VDKSFTVFLNVVEEQKASAPTEISLIV